MLTPIWDIGREAHGEEVKVIHATAFHRPLHHPETPRVPHNNTITEMAELLCVVS